MKMSVEAWCLLNHPCRTRPAAQLGVTKDKAKVVVRSTPVICMLQPARVELHVIQLLGLGFSYDQVKSMCLRQPVLLMYSYNQMCIWQSKGFLLVF